MRKTLNYAAWVKAVRPRVRSMKQVIILNPVCVSDCLIRLKLAAKVANRDSGQLVRLKCWQSNTRQQGVAIKINGTEEVTEKPQVLDKAEMAY